jgi:hypothetical protein
VLHLKIWVKNGLRSQKWTILPNKYWKNYPKTKKVHLCTNIAQHQCYFVEKKLKIMIVKNITHIYVEKINNLEIQFDIKIGDLTFMNFEKFKANKKWKSKQSNESKNKAILKEWWGECKSVAILPYLGEFEEMHDALKYQVQESLEILAFSAYPLSLNTGENQLGEMNSMAISNAVSINLKNKNSYYTTKSENGLFSFRVDQDWLTKAKKYGYFDLINLLNSFPKPKTITLEWANNLREVCKIIGRTNISSDYKNGFLMCMIALEMLLLTKEDKQKSRPLIQRLESFFGWHKEWSKEQWHEKIGKLYAKRNGIVHSGDFTKVTIEDYTFAREICFNLIFNLVKHQKYFKNKAELILYTEKIKAEKLLGIKNKIKPTKISYIRIFTGEPITDINELQKIL